MENNVIRDVFYVFEDIYDEEMQKGYLPIYHFMIPRVGDTISFESYFFDNYSNLSEEFKNLIEFNKEYVVTKVIHLFLETANHSTLSNGTFSSIEVFIKSTK